MLPNSFMSLFLIGLLIFGIQKVMLSQPLHRKAMFSAGFRGPWVLVIFLVCKLCLAMLFAFLFLLIGEEGTKSLPSGWFPIMIVVSAMAGFYTPQFWLSWNMNKRRERLAEGFTEALDLLAVCVEAGLGLDLAISRVGKEIRTKNKELGDEIQLVSLEIRAGFTREQALRNLSDRTDLEEIRNLIAIIIQTERFGTSHSQAIRGYSDSIRLTRSQKVERLAVKLPVKLLIAAIVFIIPSMLIAFIGPGTILLMRHLLP